MKRLSLPFFLQAILLPVFAMSVKAQMKQAPEVIAAYRVLQEYQQLLSENLDFERAFEATFTKNVSRQRAIAIADGEFGYEEDLKEVSDELLIKAYQRRSKSFI
jgi:hypothetical protein